MHYPIFNPYPAFCRDKRAYDHQLHLQFGHAKHPSLK